MTTKVVMLGDSLTAGNHWGRAFPELKLHNLGINGDTCAGVWARLDEAAELRPDLIFLQIGINDFLRGAVEDELVVGHLRLWEELGAKLPQAGLKIISLLPYLEEALPGLAPNLDLILTNARLREEAEKRGLEFIDLFTALADPDHQLRLEYTTDGVHLTPQAYRVWEDKIRLALASEGR